MLPQRCGRAQKRTPHLLSLPVPVGPPYRGLDKAIADMNALGRHPILVLDYCEARESRRVFPDSRSPVSIAAGSDIGDQSRSYLRPGAPRHPVAYPGRAAIASTHRRPGLSGCDGRLLFGVGVGLETTRALCPVAGPR